jgi:hypothetical protein
MNLSPGTKVLIATILLILILAALLAGHGIWSFAESPMRCAR